jgi:dinuclear metal center YbgI/SA1388 family protein
MDKMKISDITSRLEKLAPLGLQESYDNCGLLTGQGDWECTGVLVCLDCTEEILQEALDRGCNLVVAHHPVIFGGLKRLNGNGYVEKTVIRAIRNNLAIYALHTNLDNVADGVNRRIAEQIGLGALEVLSPKKEQLLKLVTYCPVANSPTLLEALFAAGAGHVGQYSECSFTMSGTGTFLPGENTNPHLGERGKRHREQEERIELVLPAFLEREVLAALKKNHPYEEVAYDLVTLRNGQRQWGSGLIGRLPEPMSEEALLDKLAGAFGQRVIRHSSLRKKPVQTVAVCGGAGASLIGSARSRKADLYVTSDLKYHDFFEAGETLLLADIGHYESEQYTSDLIVDVLKANFPNFAILKTTVNTNPVRYRVAN